MVSESHSVKGWPSPERLGSTGIVRRNYHQRAPVIKCYNPLCLASFQEDSEEAGRETGRWTERRRKCERRKGVQRDERESEPFGIVRGNQRR